MQSLRSTHLTFIRFAGPRKERIHLGAAIAAVTAAGVDDVSNFFNSLAQIGNSSARRSIDRLYLLSHQSDAPQGLVVTAEVISSKAERRRPPLSKMAGGSREIF